jgi:hypothetical protein
MPWMDFFSAAEYADFADLTLIHLSDFKKSALNLQNQRNQRLGKSTYSIAIIHHFNQ